MHYGLEGYTTLQLQTRWAEVEITRTMLRGWVHRTEHAVALCNIDRVENVKSFVKNCKLFRTLSFEYRVIRYSPNTF